MRIRAEQSILLIIDLQERMLPHVPQANEICHHAAWLMDIAHRLQIPTLMTEQYSKGLGTTVSALRQKMNPDLIIEKTHFSAVTEGQLLATAPAGRHQWIIAGTETHVCVQQTALDLLAQHQEVYLVHEALGSRTAHDKTLALARMQQHGASVVSREMVAFEWLEKANTPIFREILGQFIR